MSHFSKAIRSATALGIAAVLCSAQVASAQDDNSPAVGPINVEVAPVLDVAGNSILPAGGLATEQVVFVTFATLAVVGFGALMSGNNGNNGTSTTTTTTTTN